MPREYPEPWDESQANQVKGLLIAGVSDKRMVAAVMDCKVGDLDWLCRDAFGMTFAKFSERCELEGLARLKASAFAMATEGKNAKMLEMQLRERGLILGPVERRRQVKRETDKAEAEAREPDF